MKTFWLLVILVVLSGLAVAAIPRYPVGRSVPMEVYTAPFDPCDPAYKFFQTRYGDPNNPKYQAAPDDWIEKFGNNERTLLLHAISELRVVVAQQSQRILELEKWQDRWTDYWRAEGREITITDPNATESIHIKATTDDGDCFDKTYVGTKEQIRRAMIDDGIIDPNEGKE